MEGTTDILKALGRVLGINVHVEDDMSKEEKAKKVIGAGIGFTEADKPSLTAMADAGLDTLVAHCEAKQPDQKPAESNKIKVNGVEYTAEQIQAMAEQANSGSNPAPSPAPAADPAPAVLSEEDRAALDFGKAELNRRRQVAVETLTTNASFTAEELQGMDLGILEKMAGNIAAPRDYSARGVSAVHNTGKAKVVPLGLPEPIVTATGKAGEEK